MLRALGLVTDTTAWLCEGGVETIFKANCKTDLDATLVNALLIAQFFDFRVFRCVVIFSLAFSDVSILEI